MDRNLLFYIAKLLLVCLLTLFNRSDSNSGIELLQRNKAEKTKPFQG